MTVCIPQLAVRLYLIPVQYIKNGAAKIFQCVV